MTVGMKLVRWTRVSPYSSSFSSFGNGTMLPISKPPISLSDNCSLCRGLISLAPFPAQNLSAHKRPVSPPATGPSKQRIIAGPSKPKLTPPQLSTPPPTQPKPTKPKPTQVKHPRIQIVPGPLNPNVTAPARIRLIISPPPASTAPASLPSASVPKRKGPPGLWVEELLKTRKFHKIVDDSNEEEEEEEDVLPTPQLDRKVINHPPCGRCQKACWA
jgi:hypothetical protein